MHKARLIQTGSVIVYLLMITELWKLIRNIHISKKDPI